MRVAAFYDIHGNLPALEAVLEEVSALSVDRILVGGDIVPGPMPRECVQQLSATGIETSFIVGNGERAIAMARRGGMDPRVPAMYHDLVRWNAEQLSDADVAAMEQWPLTLTMELGESGAVLFCHATPRDDNETFVESTAEEKLRPLFDPLGVKTIVCGHTHMQFDRMVGATRIINAGSVGMPFAYWLLFDGGPQLRRTPYDLDAAAARVRSTSYPQAEEFASRSILKPPARAAMAELFAKAELR
jgi:predicted phosphodiesterase